MGALKYSKSDKIFIREANLDERWLQERIAEDPTILGLGELSLIERERVQPKGRLDLLLANYDTGVRFVTEVQLGSLDESHIIRTIEYWDIERKRFPNKEHVAVIVAEDVTSRFLNVISILGNSIPLIVLQLDTRSFGNNLFLNFIKVIDHVERFEEEEDLNIEKTDREYWLNKKHKDSMKLFDTITDLYKEFDSDISLTYNKGHIAMGGEGKRNYAWFEPRSSSYITLGMRFKVEDFDRVLDMCDKSGFEVLSRRKRSIKFNINNKKLKEHMEFFKELIKISKESSF